MKKIFAIAFISLISTPAAFAWNSQRGDLFIAKESYYSAAGFWPSHDCDEYGMAVELKNKCIYAGYGRCDILISEHHITHSGYSYLSSNNWVAGVCNATVKGYREPAP